MPVEISLSCSTNTAKLNQKVICTVQDLLNDAYVNGRLESPVKVSYVNPFNVTADLNEPDAPAKGLLNSSYDATLINSN